MSIMGTLHGRPKFDEPDVGPKKGAQCSDLGDIMMFRLRFLMGGASSPPA